MTEIDVPDWVVEVALRAGFLFVCQREGREFSEDEFRNGRDSMDAENRQAANEMMKAALTAALGAWVSPLIRAAEEEAERRPLSTHKLRAALTALRQEKPE